MNSEACIGGVHVQKQKTQSETSTQKARHSITLTDVRTLRCTHSLWEWKARWRHHQTGDCCHRCSLLYSRLFRTRCDPLRWFRLFIWPKESKQSTFFKLLTIAFWRLVGFHLLTVFYMWKYGYACKATIKWLSEANKSDRFRCSQRYLDLQVNLFRVQACNSIYTPI